MDQPGLDKNAHGQALCCLARVNWLSSTSRTIWREIRKLALETRLSRPLRILDVACGGGDVAQRLAVKARRDGIPVQVDGCDISPGAIALAREAAPRWETADVGFFEHDALGDSLPDGYDVITSSLFLHHLDDAGAEHLLRSMARAAGRLVVLNDLRRSRTGYALAWFGVRILTRSRIIQVDGPLSVAAAFTTEEAGAIATRAGMTGASVTGYFPERFLLVWRKP
jgi:SAM-dependent methyltransferase